MRLLGKSSAVGIIGILLITFMYSSSGVESALPQNRSSVTSRHIVMCKLRAQTAKYFCLDELGTDQQGAKVCQCVNSEYQKCAQSLHYNLYCWRHHHLSGSQRNCHHHFKSSYRKCLAEADDDAHCDCLFTEEHRCLRNRGSNFKCWQDASRRHIPLEQEELIQRKSQDEITNLLPEILGESGRKNQGRRKSVKSTQKDAKSSFRVFFDKIEEETDIVKDIFKSFKK